MYDAFNLTWLSFSSRPDIKKLPMHEQIQRFQWEQQRLIELYSFYTVTPGVSAAGGGGAKEETVVTDDTINDFVDNDYVGDYFV